MSGGRFLRGYVVPGMPHPLLAPERNPGWQALRDAFGKVRDEIAASGADLLLLYSTQWTSVIGHQFQADPAPEWVHVDPEWHELGDLPYAFRIDAEFAEAAAVAARERGLAARTVAYRGFPIDTGSIVALKLIDPESRIPAGIVSCNMYADRAESIVLGKAARDAVARTGRRAIAVAVSLLSARLFTHEIDPAQDRISSGKDDEWNRKILEILGEGRLEDLSQLAREIASQSSADQRMRAFWWLAGAMGETNDYEGTVFEYRPVWGTGAALAGLVPSTRPAARLEFDEESVERYTGDRAVLAAAGGEPGTGAAPLPAAPPVAPPVVAGAIRAASAPRPVGVYPHARRLGDLLYLSGIGPRQAGTDEIPGGPIRDADGNPLPYDVEAQTRAVVENVRRILEEAGSSLSKVVDVTVFLVDMKRDFATFNRVWAEFFTGIEATRTTVEVGALPTPIAVEMKVVALAG